MNILIIPDIHGRSFWEKAINDVAEHRREFDEIVFLGDYFDPYSTEHINECQAIMNWEHLYDTLFGTYLTCVPVFLIFLSQPRRPLYQQGIRRQSFQQP